MDSDTAASTLSRWFACFSFMDCLVTDQGSHFVASLMASLTKASRIRHHFTIPYCPRANGTVERLCKDVLRISKALLSKWKLRIVQWPSIIEAIHNIINHSPAIRLGKNKQGSTLCPMEDLTALKPSPLLKRPMPLRNFKDVKALDEARTRELINMAMIYEVLDQMHMDVAETNAIHRTRAQKIHNACINVLP